MGLFDNSPSTAEKTAAAEPQADTGRDTVEDLGAAIMGGGVNIAGEAIKKAVDRAYDTVMEMQAEEEQRRGGLISDLGEKAQEALTAHEANEEGEQIVHDLGEAPTKEESGGKHDEIQDVVTGYANAGQIPAELQDRLRNGSMAMTEEQILAAIREAQGGSDPE